MIHAASASASARVNDTYGGLGVLAALTSRNGTTNATKENRVHKPTDTDLDQFLAENPPWSGLTCLERLMPTRVTRHASTMSALLTSARTDRSMTVKNANTNPVVPPNGRLVSCGAL